MRECLFPSTERCGRYSTYTARGCRGDDCRAAQRIRKRAQRQTEVPFDAEVREARPARHVGLRVIDRNAQHPARARWAALIAKLEDA